MDMQFTEYTYKSFKPEDLIPDKNEVLDKKELNRIDYFNNSITGESYETLLSLYDTYANDFEKYDWDERDFIFFRCIFKEFAIRSVYSKDSDDKSPVFSYIRFKIIDNFPDNIINEKILMIQSYSAHLTNDEVPLKYSVRIKLTHKDLILNNMANTINQYEGDRDFNTFDYNWLKKLNLYVLPLYIYDKDTNKYERISVFKDRNEYSIIEDIFMTLPDYLRFFNGLNYYMLNRMENNDTMDFLKSDNSVVRSSLVEYIKCEAHEDKKIRIRLDNDIKLNLYPKNDNIYSHDNKVVRKLCDYRYMVSAHWHHYWVGSKKDGSSHKIRKWVESYERNKDKPYKIIREMYKEKEE